MTRSSSFLLLGVLLAACSSDRAGSDAPAQAGGEAYGFARAAGGRAAGRNAAHRLEVALADGALDVHGVGGRPFRMGLRWTGIGRGSRLVPVARPDGEAELTGDRASYRRAADGSEEQYVNGPLGVEQTFVLASPPAGGREEAITVEVSLSGDLAPALVAGGAGVALRDAAGATVARYTDLAAFDADGAPRRAWMEVRGGAVRLRIDDDGARYPLRVDPLVWTQTAKLIAGNGVTLDFAGTAVAVNGDTVIVGAPGHAINKGSAYVFVRGAAGWTQQASLSEPSQQGQRASFGSAVAVDGDVAVVGSPGYGPLPVVQQQPFNGAVYVFARSGNTWTKQAELTASDGMDMDLFGAAVAVNGSTLLVGAPYHQVGANAGQGAVYVYTQSGSAWVFQTEITASDGAPGDIFGSSVSLNGGTAVVGAPQEDLATPTTVGNGSAYVFTGSGSAWTQAAKLHAFDGTEGDEFGVSVSVDGTTALVGASYHRVSELVQSGSVYVFANDGTGWSQQAELGPSNAATNDAFGASVSLSGGTALIGAPQGNQAPAGVGSAYVFVQNGTTWSQVAKIKPSDGASGDQFGTSVSLDGTVAVVGAPGHTVSGANAVGVAYVFEESDGGVATTSSSSSSSGGVGGSGAGGSDATGTGGSGAASTGSGSSGMGSAFGGCGCVTAPDASPSRSLSLLALALLLAARSATRRRTRYCVQHSMSAAPGQWPAVDVPPMAAHSDVSMQIPLWPFTVQEGGGVQHSMLAAPGQWPAVDV